MTPFDSLRAAVSAQTALLAPTLYDSLSIGIGSARKRMAGRDLTRYPAQFSGLVRMDVREDLERDRVYLPQEDLRKFGADYQRYRQNVPRWIPRLHPWNPAGMADC